MVSALMSVRNCSLAAAGRKSVAWGRVVTDVEEEVWGVGWWGGGGGGGSGGCIPMAMLVVVADREELLPP